jgi:acyl-coenzyme A synthetase/AMP-(fatty) acid ligase
MKYSKHLSVIGHCPADNVLFDAEGSISYAAIPGLLAELDAYFDEKSGKDSVCIGVLMENTIAHALTILYFLSEGINFFLLSADSPVHSAMPSFCDRILSMVCDGSDGMLAGRRIRMEPNPAYHGEAMDILPCSGSAFFSSSGTSGPAKYIHYSHPMLIRNAGNCKERFGFDHRSRILVPVPVSHMYGLGVGLLPAFLSGATIGLIEKNNVVKLIAGTAGFRPSVVLLTPTVIKMLLLLNKRTTSNPIYITAGEKIGRQTYLDFEHAYGPLFNLYGCTELGAIAVSPAGDNGERIEGVVHPLEHVGVNIWGEETGQIFCRHNAGFEGYIDSRGMRRYSAELVDGAYATNDLGMVADGQGFKVLGRMDHCVNRSGFLVSLDEIEAILKDVLAGISAAVVLEYEDEKALTTKLTAVCEVYKDHSIDGDEARRICRESMNRYQVPDEFYFVSDMPRLRNGKPDRRLLDARYKKV